MTTVATAIAEEDVASKGGVQHCKFGTAAATAANATRNTVEELSEILLSNREFHRASMKDFRDNFRASLVGKTDEEKQTERKKFRISQQDKQQTFKDGQTKHRKAFFSKIESKEEKKAARVALKSLMEKEKNENGKETTKGITIDDAVQANPSSVPAIIDPNLAGKVKELSEILLLNRETHQASMNDSRSNLQASLVGKKPEEKKMERKSFRLRQQEKRQSFRNAQMEHRKSFFSNLELSLKEKKAARAALKSLMTSHKEMENHSNKKNGNVPRHKGRFFMKAARKAFRASLEGLSPIEKQLKKKAFRAEMKKVREENVLAMNARRHGTARNHPIIDSLEGLTLTTEKQRRIKRQQHSSRNNKEEQKCLLQKNKNFCHNLFLVFVAGGNGGSNDAETKKKEWQSTKVTTKKGIVKSVAAFEASLDGLSIKDQRFNWNARLAECRGRFASAMQKINHDGSNGEVPFFSSSFSPEDAMAIRKARMELIHFRRAKRNAMMMTASKNETGAGSAASAAAAISPSSPVRTNKNLKKKKFLKKLVEDDGNFTKDLDEFTSSLMGLSKKEQNIQWKNRIQDLQREARKAQAMVALTRLAKRQSHVGRGGDGRGGIIDAKGYEMIDDVDMVIVDATKGKPEATTKNFVVHENGGGVNFEDDGEDFVHLDAEN